MPATLPPWIETREGRSGIIVLAPHGGRRRRPIRRGDSVNDLYTAEIATELAERLDAPAFINHGLDRNESDLNRISHLARDQGWLLEALRERVEALVVSGRAPLLVFVHGWNMVVPCCDVGVGLRNRGVMLTGRYPTVSRQTFDDTVRPMIEAVKNAGLEAALGLRYPGSGKDNALQIFSGRYHEHADADVARLSQLALMDSVDAVQLELGIPLRWEGARRGVLVEALVESFRVAAAGRPLPDAPAAVGLERRRGWDTTANRPRSENGPAPEQGYNLQAVLGEGAGGLFAGVEATGPDSMACRICLVNTDGSMNLFVAEDDWSGEPGVYESHGLSWRVRPHEMVLEAGFRGAMVSYPSHDAYEDLEAGLAGSHLVEAELNMRFEERSDGFGNLKYSISLDGVDSHGSCVAALDRGGRRNGGAGPRSRVFVTESGAGPFRVHGPEAVTFREGRDGCPEGIEISAEQGSFSGHVTACVPVWRQLPGGGSARFTFGLAEFSAGDRPGPATARGLYDRLEFFTDGEQPA